MPIQPNDSVGSLTEDLDAVTKTDVRMAQDSLRSPYNEPGVARLPRKAAARKILKAAGWSQKKIDRFEQEVQDRHDAKTAIDKKYESDNPDLTEGRIEKTLTTEDLDEAKSPFPLKPLPGTPAKADVHTPMQVWQIAVSFGNAEIRREAVKRLKPTAGARKVLRHIQTAQSPNMVILYVKALSKEQAPQITRSILKNAGVGVNEAVIESIDLDEGATGALRKVAWSRAGRRIDGKALDAFTKTFGGKRQRPTTALNRAANVFLYRFASDAEAAKWNTALNQHDMFGKPSRGTVWNLDEANLSRSVPASYLLKKYQRNEDNNYHTENLVLLTQAYGTVAQYRRAKAWQKKVEKERGYDAGAPEATALQKLTSPMYQKLVKDAKADKAVNLLEALDEATLRQVMRGVGNARAKARESHAPDADPDKVLVLLEAMGADTSQLVEDAVSEVRQVLTEDEDATISLPQIMEATLKRPDETEEPLAKRYVQYQKRGNVFSPAPDMTFAEELGRHAYRVVQSMQGIEFHRAKAKTDTLLKFENSIMESVLHEIDRFWGLREDYAEMGVLHNRGILLEGTPGNGKSCLIQQVVEQMVERGDVVFFTNRVRPLKEALRAFRDIEPNRNVVVVLEDADEHLQYEQNDFLQLLDGDEAVEGVLYLATTNYLDRFPERLKRPGRFDKIVNVPPPPMEGRLAYLTNKLAKPAKGAKNGKPVEDTKEIERLARVTEGMSFGHLREFVTAVYAIGDDKATTITRLRAQTGIPAPGVHESLTEGADTQFLNAVRTALAAIQPAKGGKVIVGAAQVKALDKALKAFDREATTVYGKAQSPAHTAALTGLRIAAGQLVNNGSDGSPVSTDYTDYLKKVHDRVRKMHESLDEAVFMQDTTKLSSPLARWEVGMKFDTEGERVKVDRHFDALYRRDEERTQWHSEPTAWRRGLDAFPVAANKAAAKKLVMDVLRQLKVKLRTSPPKKGTDDSITVTPANLTEAASDISKEKMTNLAKRFFTATSKEARRMPAGSPVWADYLKSQEKVMQVLRQQKQLTGAAAVRAFLSAVSDVNLGMWMPPMGGLLKKYDIQWDKWSNKIDFSTLPTDEAIDEAAKVPQVWASFKTPAAAQAAVKKYGKDYGVVRSGIGTTTKTDVAFQLKNQADQSTLAMTLHQAGASTRKVMKPTDWAVYESLDEGITPINDLHRKMRAFLKREAHGLVDELHDMDLEAAIYWFASDHHGGQGSKLYQILSRSEYTPARSERNASDAGFNAEMLYDALDGDKRRFQESDAMDEGTKGAYQFAPKEQQYRTMTTASLRHAVKDAGEAMRSMQGHDAQASNWYADDVHTINKELNRRKSGGKQESYGEQVRALFKKRKGWKPVAKETGGVTLVYTVAGKDAKRANKTLHDLLTQTRYDDHVRSYGVTKQDDGSLKAEIELISESLDEAYSTKDSGQARKVLVTFGGDKAEAALIHKKITADTAKTPYRAVASPVAGSTFMLYISAGSGTQALRWAGEVLEWAGAVHEDYDTESVDEAYKTGATREMGWSVTLRFSKDTEAKDAIRELERMIRKTPHGLTGPIIQGVNSLGRVVTVHVSGAQKNRAEMYVHSVVQTKAGVASADPKYTVESALEVANTLSEKAPPGFSGTVKAMKKHMSDDKAFALAWDMFKKGAKPHYAPEPGKSTYQSPEAYAAAKAQKESLDEGAVKRAHEKAVAQLMKEFPELKDWPEAELNDTLSTTSPRMSAKDGKIQQRYVALFRKIQGRVRGPDGYDGQAGKRTPYWFVGNRKTYAQPVAGESVDSVSTLDEAQAVGKAQKALLAWLQQNPGNMWHNLSDITRFNAALRGVHFKQVMSAAAALAKKGLITYDGSSRVSLKEDYDPLDEGVPTAAQAHAAAWKAIKDVKPTPTRKATIKRLADALIKDPVFMARVWHNAQPEGTVGYHFGEDALGGLFWDWKDRHRIGEGTPQGGKYEELSRDRDIQTHFNKALKTMKAPAAIEFQKPPQSGDKTTARFRIFTTNPRTYKGTWVGWTNNPDEAKKYVKEGDDPEAWAIDIQQGSKLKRRGYRWESVEAREWNTLTEAYTPGLQNALAKLRSKGACPTCGFQMPVYPGRYPKACPHCTASQTGNVPSMPKQDMDGTTVEDVFTEYTRTLTSEVLDESRDPMVAGLLEAKKQAAKQKTYYVWRAVYAGSVRLVDVTTAKKPRRRDYPSVVNPAKVQASSPEEALPLLKAEMEAEQKAYEKRMKPEWAKEVRKHKREMEKDNPYESVDPKVAALLEAKVEEARTPAHYNVTFANNIGAREFVNGWGEFMQDFRYVSGTGGKSSVVFIPKTGKLNDLKYGVKELALGKAKIVKGTLPNPHTTDDDGKPMPVRLGEALLLEGMPPWVKATLATINGNRGLMMIGAKHIGYSDKDKTVSFKIGRNSSGGNYLTIQLDQGRDLYNVKIQSVRKDTAKVKHEAKGLYGDQVGPWVTKKTGMYLSLGTMGRTESLDAVVRYDMVRSDAELAESDELRFHDLPDKAQETARAVYKALKADVLSTHQTAHGYVVQMKMPKQHGPAHKFGAKQLRTITDQSGVRWLSVDLKNRRVNVGVAESVEATTDYVTEGLDQTVLKVMKKAGLTAGDPQSATYVSGLVDAAKGVGKTGQSKVEAAIKRLIQSGKVRQVIQPSASGGRVLYYTESVDEASKRMKYTPPSFARKADPKQVAASKAATKKEWERLKQRAKAGKLSMHTLAMWLQNNPSPKGAHQEWRVLDKKLRALRSVAGQMGADVDALVMAKEDLDEDYRMAMRGSMGWSVRLQFSSVAEAFAAKKALTKQIKKGSRDGALIQAVRQMAQGLIVDVTGHNEKQAHAHVHRIVQQHAKIAQHGQAPVAEADTDKVHALIEAMEA